MDTIKQPMDYLSLCLICRDENDYLPEWLDYHILMGVDRFYVYDNESRVSLRESLKDYVERGWVVVLDIPGKAMQLFAYVHCLQTFGENTFWLGFIDTDEFLVPKTTLDLKEFLKGYEQYGGLAVSSLFFGTNGHQTRPMEGQISAYTRRTHSTFKENELVKSIVQPKFALMPNSPHDFIYKESAWCVNERSLRVDYQRFPNYTELIQLNHYYCRSKSELEQKLNRGRGDTVDAWARQRFDTIISMATNADTVVLDNLARLIGEGNLPQSGVSTSTIPEKMAILVQGRRPSQMSMLPPREACDFSPEFSSMEVLKAQIREAEIRKEFDEVKRLMLLRIQITPHNIILYLELAVVLHDMGDPHAAWQSLSQAWELSPNNFVILISMAFYFLRVKNFIMAENTCRLLLNLAPHDLVVLGQLTHSLIGQGRYEDALKVGLPVVELSALVGELPDRMGGFLVKKMADYLLEKKDYKSAVRLWEAGIKCQPGEVTPLIELAKSFLLAGDKFRARQVLGQAQGLAPQNEALLAFAKQSSISLSGDL